MKIEPAAGRKLPRKFKFPWGSGLIIEEASIKCTVNDHSWEPTVQLLKVDNGSKLVRFCVYRNNRLSRMPLVIDGEQLYAIKKQILKNGQLAAYLREFLTL